MTHRQTDRQTDRGTETEQDKERQKKRDRRERRDMDTIAPCLPVYVCLSQNVFNSLGIKFKILKTFCSDTHGRAQTDRQKDEKRKTERHIGLA